MKTCTLVLTALVCSSALYARAGQWTYNSGSATLSHDTSGWVLAASRNGTNLTVTGVSQSPGAPAALPLSDPMPGFALVSIGADAFFYCASLTLITIPASVSSIGSDAFSGCTGLTSITIPNSVTSIGRFAFYGCTGLTSITLPDRFATISDGTFYDCASLTSVNIPDSVNTIGDSAFSRCQRLTSIAIPGSTTNIGVSSFSCCTSLTSVTIPASVAHIGDDSFGGCTSLASITVHPDNPTYASADGVLFNKSLTSLIQCPGGRGGDYTVPNSVTSIGGRAFSECTSLNSVIIPASVASIGGEAFCYCTDLMFVLFMGMPPELLERGLYVFLGTPATLYYLDGTPGWPATFGGKRATPFPFDFSLADGQITIVSYTGRGRGAPSVQIPASFAGYPVTAIGEAAFYGQTDIIAVHIPDSVTSVGRAAFAGCTGLQTVGLGSHVTELGNWAFYGCSSLAAVYARGNAPILGVSAFTGTHATVFHIPGTTGWGDTFGGRPAVLLPYAYAVMVGTVRIDAYFGDSATVEVPAAIEDLPVTVIGDSAFENCGSLVSVTIPNSVQSIGDAAFCNCPLLSNVQYGYGMSSIGDWAFAGCESLTSIIIPYVERIGNYAFAFCPALSGVYLNCSPAPIVGKRAFEWTAAIIYYPANGVGWSATLAGRPTSPMLYSFSVVGGTATINSYFGSDTNPVAIPSVIDGMPVAAIGEWAFHDCALTSATIPSCVTSIGDGAFFGCSGLTSIAIPASVTNIGYWAFSGCTSLASITVHPSSPNYASIDGVLFDKDITVLLQCPGGFSGVYAIPSGVTSIGNGAFYSCTGLTSVTIPVSVTNIAADAFGNCTSLTSVTIPGSVTSIGDYAFDNCASLTSVTIPGSVTAIGFYAFGNCTGLASVFFTGDAPSIDPYAFYFTPATIYYTPGTSGWGASVGGCPAVCWNPAFSPASAPSFSSGTFGFTLTGTPNIPVKVEATTNLSSSVWVSITNAALNSSGSLAVTDPAASALPARFYRIVWP